MRISKWIAQLTIGMLLSSAGLADDAKYDHGQGPAVDRALADLLAESAHAPGWQLSHPLEPMTYSDYWLQPMADIEFQDNSVLGRVSKFRNLSLLMLAESSRSRLFLGINGDGLLGLHFVAMPKHGDERYLSLARMPYLKKDKPDGANQSL